ncbi:hypothetical protein ACFVDT_03170 [Streptomyces sp. NPDC057699]|uniref:hypothetical protein n=1 Tax=Streptomyces sp. NPDC057699 TaxID=3346220 RepID=UPI00368D8816
MGFFRRTRPGSRVRPEHPVGVQGQMQRHVGDFVGHPVDPAGEAQMAGRSVTDREAVAVG